MTRGDLASAFDDGFLARAPHLGIRPETEDDKAFLLHLFKATFPWPGALPLPLLEMQAATHNAHCRTAYPDAMCRILTRGGAPVGRIALDWVPGDHTMGVDIAVLPEIAGSGVGSAMLRSWMATADAVALPCRFTVRADNPARRIYAHLGFVDESDVSPYDTSVRMFRKAGG